MNTISNIIARLKEYINQHDKIFGWIVVPLILFFLTTFVFNNIMKYFGKVEITNESFINVPKTVNGEELIQMFWRIMFKLNLLLKTINLKVQFIS